MKLKPFGPNAPYVKTKFPGVQIRATKQGVVAQANPTKKPKPRSKLQQQYSQRFAFAGIMASNAEPREALTAIELSKGTEQVPRDILSMAAMGRYYAVINKDGTFWRHCSKPTTTDPDCVRASALRIGTTGLPWQNSYISIGNGRRLKI